MLKAIRRRVHLSQREDGFTLVELVVAMVIIAGVLMALIGVQISAASTIVDARKREQATAVANEAMEQLRAIPWAYLSKGMYNGFITQAGGDPFAAGATLTLPSGTKTLIIAPASANQDVNNPRPPLFSETGSNKQVVFDAALTNTSYTVRAYVAQPAAGGINTVDLVVYVQWTNNRGETSNTVVESTAYRGTGCGDELSSPYLTACQAYFDASSSSGSLITSVRATTADALGVTTDTNLLHPTSDVFTSLTMRSASAAAAAQAQQVSLLTGAAQFGGTVKDDADDATEPAEQGWTHGYVISRVTATSDVTQTNTPLHVASTTLTQSSGAESSWDLAASGTDISFRSRSDFRRPTTAMASSTASCKTGIPAGQACAITIIDNNASIEEGSGYMLMFIGDAGDDAIFRLSRRLAEQAPPANADEAWVARFSSQASTNAAVGCQTVTGAGCISAGASRTMAELSIGHAVAPDAWSASAAPDGLVIIEGATGCTTGFRETVMVERGTSQKATVPTYTRCGQIRWWTGGAYSTATFAIGNAGPYTTDAVTWTDGTYTVTATASVNFTAGSYVATGTDATCVADACAISAHTGSISIVVNYAIISPTGDYTVVSVTTIDGPSAQIAYREAPVA